MLANPHLNAVGRDSRMRPLVPLFLVGCGKLKRDRACKAQEMYTGELFQKARRFAESHKAPWAIVSAKHGILHPGDVIEPYELSLAQLDRQARGEWIDHTACQLENLLVDFGKARHVGENLIVQDGTTLGVFAGRDYVEALREMAVVQTCRVLEPLKGLGIGQRLRWFNMRTETGHACEQFIDAAKAKGVI